MRGDDVLVRDGVSGEEFTLDDYRSRFFEVEGFLLGFFEERGLDWSGVILEDSEDLVEDEDFLWPVFVLDHERGTQGYCDLFGGPPEDQALFLFEQLMGKY